MQWILALLAFLFATSNNNDLNSSLIREQNKSYSTSVESMKKLLLLEAELINNLDEYANKLEHKIQVLRSFTSELRNENDKSRLDMENYLSNPINAFKLIRRMQRDWNYWQWYMKQPVGKLEENKVEELSTELPSKTDLEEAAEAVYRIQTTYDLKVSHMTTGMLNGRQYNVSFSALDSYAMGQYQYYQSNFGEATHWFYHAIEWVKVNNLSEPLSLNRKELVLLYTESLIKLNRFDDALYVINIICEERGYDAKLMSRKIEIETMISTESYLKPPTVTKNSPSDYEIGCRGNFPVPPPLYCIYNHTTTPFLRLAPLRMEILHLDPYLVKYHDVLSTREISELQEMAKSSLERTRINQSNSKVVSNTRTAKGSWISQNYNELTLRITKRIADMSGLDMLGSEKMQVINYGLGGHYKEHYDYFNTSNTENNRITTVLFYLTDVEQGGATVFLKFKQAVFPKRGSAIMWHNLKSSGEPNNDTLHAACPVIVGSKWVMTKWIRVNEQIFKKPCFYQ